jgi:hypothetical protein
MALNLVTLGEYKTYAGIKSTNYDREIAGLIPRVSELVKKYCNKTFVDYVDTDKVEYFNGATSYGGAGQSKFILHESPVISVSQVALSTDYGQNYIPLVQYVDWVQDGDEVLAIGTQAFIKYIRGYKVTYRAGYDDVPVDIALAIMDLITYYRQSDMSIHSNKAPGTNNVQIEYITTTQLPAHIRRILDLYKSDYT